MNSSRLVYPLLALGAALLLLNAGQAAGPVKVKLGTIVPKGSSSYKILQDMGAKWAAAPGGGISLQIYPDGQMGGEADMVRRMRVGQLQAGLLSVVGLSEIEPGVGGLQNMPMVFRDFDEVDYVGEKLQPLLAKRLEEKGFVVVFWGDAGFIRFFSKQPVVHPDDLKKAKLFVWAGSAVAVDIYKSAGFDPVALETADIIPSLQTGLISAVPLPPFFALASQVDGPAPHMVDVNWAPLVGAVVLSKKVWDTIPAEGRKQMMAAAAEAGKLVRENNRRESAEAIQAMEKRGLKIQKLTPEITEEWRKAAEAVHPRIRGTLVPTDIFDEVVRLLKERRAAAGAK